MLEYSIKFITLGDFMLKDKKNSRKQGDAGLGIAIGWFAKQEWTICFPLTDNQDYDLVVEKDFGLKKCK